MSPHQHFTKFFIISLACHILAFAAAVYLIKPALTPLPTTTPVEIVNIPREQLKQLPTVARPIPPSPRIPLIPMPETLPKPRAIPTPKQFGTAPDVVIPKTLPPDSKPGTRGGGEEGTGLGKTAPKKGEPGPLPFLSQTDIDNLARKGMPKRKPGDDSVTLDTDEFKYISYNRWLEVKINAHLRFPELAKISGMQGIVYIQINILKDGSLGSVDILKSSGYKLLDDEVVESIRLAAPFQQLPDEWHVDHYSILGYGYFFLGQGYIR
jgi:protein TonB